MIVNRNEKILAGVGIVATVLFVAATQLKKQGSNGITLAWVQEKLIEWKPASWQPINFTLQLNRASYDNPELSYNSLTTLQADLAFLLTLNPTSIRLDIGFDAFANNDIATISNLDSIVSEIRAAGKQLVIADGAREYYRKHPEPWTQFQADWLTRVQTLALRYKPDYYVVIKEPGWYAPMISDATTNPAVQSATSWVSLLDTLGTAVKAQSPLTKTGISIAADALSQSNAALYWQMMIGASGLASNDILGFDIYSANGYTQTQMFLQANPTAKAVWIAEAWSDTSPSVAFNSSRAQLDQEWTEVVYDFALKVGASELNYFFDDCFCNYNLNSLTNPSQIQSEYASQKTPAYSTLKALTTGSIPAF